MSWTRRPCAGVAARLNQNVCVPSVPVRKLEVKHWYPYDAVIASARQYSLARECVMYVETESYAGKFWSTDTALTHSAHACCIPAALTDYS